MAICLQDYGNRSMDKFNGTDLPGGMRKHEDKLLFKQKVSYDLIMLALRLR